MDIRYLQRPLLPRLVAKYEDETLFGLAKGVVVRDSAGGIPILTSPMRLSNACSAIRISRPISRLSKLTPSG